jgi:N-methylhydantoinase A
MTHYKVAVDIGGTFTDFIVADEEKHEIRSGKVSTTSENFSIGVLRGLRDFIPAVEDIDFIVHGTTVGLNTFLERKGKRVLLITTAGFRDSYVIARGDRKELYALQYHKPERLVPRRDVHEVRERITWDGTVVEDLHPEDFELIIEKINKNNILSVAICFLHSYINPIHELAAQKILQDAIPNLSVTLSHQVAREWREYERASTSVMNAYIAPAVEKYLTSLDKDMSSLKIPAKMHVMQSNGGIITSSSAAKLPIRTLLSGPVGGTIGGKSLSKTLARPNLICVDMGGTSFDMSIISNGEPIVRSETELQGIPLLLPVVAIHTIGAGGGSIAGLDGNALRVGPQSAGADPGPACYGKGGLEPTVTDANLFLNRINPRNFLGGKMILDVSRSASALSKIANKLNITPTKLAEGMINIINSKMADAIRTITIEHGIDPRLFSLVAFGGAGPMHAVWLARDLQIPEVIVPWYPGAFSAWGMLQTDIRQDLVSNFYISVSNTRLENVQAEFYRLEKEGEKLLDEEGIKPSDMSFLWFADMRYVGQEHSILVSFNRADTLTQMTETFHRTHYTKFGHSTPEDPAEFVNLRVAAYGRTGVVDARYSFGSQNGMDPIIEYRDVIFDGIPVRTKILDRNLLYPNAVFQSPLVMEEPTATTVVPPGYKLIMDKFGNVIITKE